MCKFFSMVQVFRNGGIDTYYDELEDSHSWICKSHNLDELSVLGDSRMVKIELVPRDKSKYLDLEQYDFVIDEKRVPSWCAEHRNEMEKQAYASLRKILQTSLSIERCVALNIQYCGTQTTVKGTLDCSDYTGDLSALTSVGGYLDCRGYTGDLSALTSVGGYLDCRDYTGDLSALTSVGGNVYCSGYTGDLSALTSVGGYLDCRDYTGDLSALTSVGGYLYCRDYTGKEKLKKQLGR